MKKCLSVCLALLLAGCAAAEPADPVPTPVPAEETAGTVLFPELTALHTQWGLTMGKDAAYVPTVPEGGAARVATKISLDTGEQSVLCHLPGCAHTDEGCPAYLWTAGSCVASDALIAVGDKLYWLVDGRYNGSAGAYIDVSGLDGSNRRRIAEGDSLPELDPWATYLTDGDTLYFSNANVAGGSLFRIDETGVTRLWEPPQQDPNTYCACLAVWEGKPVFTVAENGPIEINLEEPPEGASDEEWEAYSQECDRMIQEIYDNRRHALYVLDADGDWGSPVAEWKSAEGDPFEIFWKDKAYGVDGDGVPCVTDLTTGAREKFLPEGLAGEAQGFNYSTGGYAVLFVMQNGQEAWYACDLEGNKAVPLNATWYKDNAVPRAPYPLADNGETAFLQVGAEYYTATTFGPDGVPSQFTTCNFNYAVMPLAEYMAGSQDWTPVTLLAKDIV